MENKKNHEHLCRIVKHPVLQHKLTHLRKVDTRPAEFRRILEEISCLLAYEVTRDLRLRDESISTPLEKAPCPVIDEDLILVSIQRAGSGMLAGALQTLPFARVGHIGIYRDKFIHNTVEYYFRIPNNSEGKKCIVVDPLLATGDTAVAALDRLKEYGSGPITWVSIVSAPEGLARVKEAHPDVVVYTLSVDRQLNEKGYILPGLGDAGDRLFGTL